MLFNRKKYTLKKEFHQKPARSEMDRRLVVTCF
jgi:hypothetical protein